MKIGLLEVLRCPACQGRLELTSDVRVKEIESGSMRCQGCELTYPIIRSIPRFVPSDQYTRNFSAQWNLFAKTQLDPANPHNQTSSRDTFLEKTGFEDTCLEHKFILDAGCGMGRFLDVVSRVKTANVVGVDLSMAVESAAGNVGNRPNVNIVQADIMNPPFAPGVFDLAYSIGVLHHTPDPMVAFAKVVSLIKEGGEVSIWVYPKYDWTMFSDMYRHMTWRMPWSMLLGIVKTMVMLHSIDAKLPKILKRYLDLLLPISNERDIEARLLGTYDWYSPRFQFKLTPSEVLSWFNNQSLKHIQLLSTPVSVRALK